MPRSFQEKLVVSPVLIGRADLLASLDALTEQVRRGRGAIALVGGEAGIGKSRLVAQVRTRAAEMDWNILLGHCFEQDTALPYAPLLDLLRTYCAGNSTDEIMRAWGPAASDLVKLLPEMAPRLTAVVPSPTLEPEQEKYHLFESLIAFLFHSASPRPLLLVVEDLHWSDNTSLDFLLRLARRLAGQSILLVLTFRTDESSPSLTHFLAELDRGRLATELRLNRLSLDEVGAMLRAIFELERPVRPAFLDAIYPLSEGNPFFIEEILKSLIVAGAIYYSNGAWDRMPLDQVDIPRSVQDAVHRRLAQVSPPARQTLTLAAIAGRVVSFSLIQELGHMSEPELVAQLKELVGAQFLVEESSDRFAFRHALTRQAVYGALLKRERQKYHRTIAETLERMNGQSSGVPLADLSLHFYEGAVWDKALEYSQRAGEQAQALYAPREAIQHFTRALQAANELAAPVPPGLSRARGQAHETLGDFDAAHADYEHALDAARASHDGVAEWHLLIDLGFLWAGREYRRTGEYFQLATDLAQRLGDSKLHAQSLNRLANWYVNVGRIAEGLQTHRHALEIFERARDLQGRADSLDLLGMADWQLGDEADSHRQYAHAIPLFRELNDKRGLASALIGLSHSSYWDETVVIPIPAQQEDLRNAAEALELTRQIGWVAGQAYGEWTLGVDLASFGQLGDALAHAQQSLQMAVEIEHRQWIAAAHYALGYIYVSMQLPEPAIQNLEIALPMASALGSEWWIGNITTDLARAYLLKNDPARAVKTLDNALPRDQVPHSVAERRMVWARALALFVQGEPQAALALGEQLIESAPGTESSRRIPWLLKLRGESLAALGRLEEGQQALEEARQGALERHEPPLLWQVQRSLGRVYQRLKRADKAEIEFAAARETVQAMAETIPDAALRQGMLRTALESLPQVKPVSPRRAEADKFGGLTARERDVARLVANGKTNHEIAEALVLSERTVEYHVGNILSKLAFDTRSQIAVWAVEKDLGAT